MAAQIVIVDVESTCWQRQPPAGEQSEIIEDDARNIARLAERLAERYGVEGVLLKPDRI
jgi:hypothetical protein